MDCQPISGESVVKHESEGEKAEKGRRCRHAGGSARNQNEALRIIVDTRKARRTFLDLRGQHLNSFPANLTRNFPESSNLTRLELSNNIFTELPVCVLRLSSLVHLRVANNRITAVPGPDIVSGLPSLVSLDLERNQITLVPPSLGSHPSLADINLSGNRISQLEPGALRAPRLRSFHLVNNPIQNVPKSVVLRGVQSMRAYFGISVGPCEREGQANDLRPGSTSDYVSQDNDTTMAEGGNSTRQRDGSESDSTLMCKRPRRVRRERGLSSSSSSSSPSPPSSTDSYSSDSSLLSTASTAIGRLPGRGSVSDGMVDKRLKDGSRIIVSSGGVSVHVPAHNKSSISVGKFTLSVVVDAVGVAGGLCTAEVAPERVVHCGPVARLEPHGAKFYDDEPAVIILSLGAEAGDASQVTCLCSDTPALEVPDWKPISPTMWDYQDGKVRIRTHHFSMFTVILNAEYPEQTSIIQPQDGGHLTVPEVTGLEVIFPQRAVTKEMVAKVKVFFDDDPADMNSFSSVSPSRCGSTRQSGSSSNLYPCQSSCMTPGSNEGTTAELSPSANTTCRSALGASVGRSTTPSPVQSSHLSLIMAGALASPIVCLEPHNVVFEQWVTVRLPVPDFEAIVRIGRQSSRMGSGVFLPPSSSSPLPTPARLSEKFNRVSSDCKHWPCRARRKHSSGGCEAVCRKMFVQKAVSDGELCANVDGATTRALTARGVDCTDGATSANHTCSDGGGGGDDSDDDDDDAVRTPSLTIFTSSAESPEAVCWEELHQEYEIEQDKATGHASIVFRVKHFSWYKAMWDIVAGTVHNAKVGVSYFFPRIRFSMMSQAMMDENLDTKSFALEVIFYRSDKKLPESGNYVHRVGGSTKPKLVRPGCIGVRLVSKAFEADDLHGEDASLQKMENDFHGMEFEKQFACVYRCDKMPKGVIGKCIVERFVSGGATETIFEYNLSKNQEELTSPPDNSEQWSLLATKELAGMLNITDDDWLAFARKLKFSDQEIRVIEDREDHFEAMIQAYKGTPTNFLQVMYSLGRKLRQSRSNALDSTTSVSSAEEDELERNFARKFDLGSLRRSSTPSRKRNRDDSGSSAGEPSYASYKKRKRSDLSDSHTTEGSNDAEVKKLRECKEEVTRNVLWKLSEFISSNWKSLGRLLCLTEEILLAIGSDGDDREKTYQVLLRWRERFPDQCTYGILYQALCDCGMNGVARAYCRFDRQNL